MDDILCNDDFETPRNQPEGNLFQDLVVAETVKVRAERIPFKNVPQLFHAEVFVPAAAEKAQSGSSVVEIRKGNILADAEAVYDFEPMQTPAKESPHSASMRGWKRN